MDNGKTNSDIVHSLLHTINQVAIEERHIVEDGKDLSVTNKKFFQIGNELNIPRLLVDESYITNRQTSFYSYLATLEIDVLTPYLKKKNSLSIPRSINRNESFKYPRFSNSNNFCLTFLDFYIVHQSSKITEIVLEYQEGYGYEHEGIVELAARTAIYMFENIIEVTGDTYGNSSRPNEFPGLNYAYKEGTDFTHFIKQEMHSVDGIYEYEHEEEEDGEWDDE